MGLKIPTVIFPMFRDSFHNEVDFDVTNVVFWVISADSPHKTPTRWCNLHNIIVSVILL